MGFNPFNGLGAETQERSKVETALRQAQGIVKRLQAELDRRTSTQDDWKWGFDYFVYDTPGSGHGVWSLYDTQEQACEAYVKYMCQIEEREPYPDEVKVDAPYRIKRIYL